MGEVGEVSDVVWPVSLGTSLLQSLLVSEKLCAASAASCRGRMPLPPLTPTHQPPHVRTLPMAVVAPGATGVVIVSAVWQPKKGAGTQMWRADTASPIMVAATRTSCSLRGATRLSPAPASSGIGAPSPPTCCACAGPAGAMEGGAGSLTGCGVVD